MRFILLTLLVSACTAPQAVRVEPGNHPATIAERKRLRLGHPHTLAERECLARGLLSKRAQVRTR